MTRSHRSLILAAWGGSRNGAILEVGLTNFVVVAWPIASPQALSNRAFGYLIAHQLKIHSNDQDVGAFGLSRDTTTARYIVIICQANVHLTRVSQKRRALTPARPAHTAHPDWRVSRSHARKSELFPGPVPTSCPDPHLSPPLSAVGHGKNGHRGLGERHAACSQGNHQISIQLRYGGALIGMCQVVLLPWMPLLRLSSMAYDWYGSSPGVCGQVTATNCRRRAAAVGRWRIERDTERAY